MNGNSPQEKPQGGTFDAAHFETKKVAIDPEKLKQFKNGNLSAIPCDCGDGRPNLSEDRFDYKRFGGPTGYAIDLTAALNDYKKQHPTSLTVADILEVTKKAFGGTLGFHGDDHEGGHEHMGCGYCKFSLVKTPEEFGLTLADTEAITDAIKGGPRTEMKGKHAEEGIIFITKDELIPRALPGEKQAFIFNQGLDNQAIAVLVDALSKKDASLNKEVFLQTVIARRDQNVGTIVEKLGVTHLLPPTVI